MNTTSRANFTATAYYSDNHSYNVNWTIGPDRFHVWTDEHGNVQNGFGKSSPTLYKNSVAKIREPGHHDCRYLDATAACNQEMIEQALSQVDLTKAKALHEQQEAEKEAKRIEEDRKGKALKRLHEAAPELLAALAEAVRIMEATQPPDGGSTEQAIKQARAAITKATQP